MLIEFRVRNFRSFQEEQVFSLMKGKETNLPDNSFEIACPHKCHVLKSAAIFGANASGKSNFLNALKTMKRIVVSSSQTGFEIPVSPFRLNNVSVKEPTEFEVTFIVEGIRYQYGFATTKDVIVEEWLFAFPKGRAQTWFMRSFDSRNQVYHWSLGSNLMGEKKVWQRSTRKNALFLSTAVQLNSQQLKPIFDWFREKLRVVGMELSPKFSAQLCLDGSQRAVLDLLKAADLHIEDLDVKSEDVTPSSLPEGLPTELKDILFKQGAKVLKVQTVHKNNIGENIPFNLSEEESDGTRKVFALAGPLLDVLNNGYILAIDELNSRLHPKLEMFIIRMFHNPNINRKNAQLIFTSHATPLMNEDSVLRRDQIWFCEKNRSKQFSTIYSAADFKSNKGENLESFYLSGRYGALPYVQELVEI